MMKICLDTNAYSAFKRNHQDLVELMEETSEIFLPVVVYGELAAGFYSGSKTKRNFDELHDFLQLPGVSLVPVTQEIADRYGQIVKILALNGTPLPVNDIWVAATVFDTGSHLVTYDKHFQKVHGLSLLSP